MPALNSARIEAAATGFRGVFLKAFEGADLDWSGLAMQTTSANATETYDFLTGMPGMKELIGEVKLEDVASAGFSIANKEWEATITVPRAVIERDSEGLFRPQFAELGTNARNHPRTLLATLLNNAFTALDYTGTSFFNTVKPYDKDDKSKGAPTFGNRTNAALSAAAFIAARTSLRKMRDAKGNNLGLGMKLLLIVPPALEETANKLRVAENISITGGSTDTNTLRGTFEVKVMNELTSDTAWFLVESGREIKPLIVQMEIQPEFIAADDPKSPHVLLQKKFIYQAYYRGNAGYALPQLAYGSTGV